MTSSFTARPADCNS